MSGPDVLGLGGGQVLLRGRVVADCARAVRATVEVGRRRDGLVPPPRLLGLLSVLEAEAREVAGRGHADVRETDDLADSLAGAHEAVTTREVAAALDLSERQVRRLAADLGAKRLGGRWNFDPAAVTALANERRTQ